MFFVYFYRIIEFGLEIVVAKINSFSDKFSFFKSSEKKKKEKSRKAGKVEFSQAVESILESREAENNFDYSGSGGDDLEQLLDDVCRLGEVLKENPTFNNIRQYKQSIQQFLKLVMGQVVGVEEHISGVNILKRKRFTLVNVVNQKLESLVVQILNNQSKQLEILSKIDEINGLLVDLTR